ncbi:MAG: HAD family hydrolase [Acidimicrobiia bacterium]
MAAFLASRGIDLPRGTALDPPETPTVWGLANQKNQLFLEALERDGALAFPDAVSLLRRLRAAGVPTAVVTADANAAAVLAAAGAADLADVVVDGTDAARRGLPTEPDPAMLLEAVARMGAHPAHAVLIEDAAGVPAPGQAGRFGVVVGLRRGEGATPPPAASADVVIADLGQVVLGPPPEGDQADPWVLAYDGYDPAHEGHREALCTTANGYLGTRGAAPDAAADGTHYPGTYLAGCYDRESSDLGGRRIERESIVNAPNWLAVTFRAEGGDWFRTDAVRLLSYRQELDLRAGVLTRRLRFEDAGGRRSTLVERRLVHAARPHLAALEVTLVPEGWSGRVEWRSGIDGRVRNANTEEDRRLGGHHLRPVEAGNGGGVAHLEVETLQSHIRIAVAARSLVSVDGHPVELERRPLRGYALAGEEVAAFVGPGQSITLEKVTAYYTSRDHAISEPLSAARAEVADAPPFAELAASHAAAWGRLWRRFAMSTGAPPATALALHLHTFHLLQSVPAGDVDLDAGVGPRGLHGEGYRGHVFWDELFVFPVLNLRRPDLTRALLLYRWRRLDAARRAARAAGLAGAMFPWQSGSDGREETPEALYNPRSGSWMADRSHRQRHVGLAVAYNAWQYWQASGDVDFLVGHGAELLVEVSRFFASLATRDEADGRYHINGVMGPDEFHDGYPGADEAGLRDNTYTNVLAAWVLWRTLEVVETLSRHHCGELWDRLALNEDELIRWENVSRHLAVVTAPDGRLSAFEGYEDLAELDWERYRARYGNIGRLDLILAAEGDSTNRYKASKQADVLMLFYLFSAEELCALLERLGHPFDPATIPATVEYYLARTSHGSTLCRVVHAWVLARSDRARSWHLLAEALRADLDDTQGGTTAEGIHLGAMAATVDLLQRCYLGVETRDGALWLNPWLPQELPLLRAELVYRGQWLTVDATHERLRVRATPCQAGPISISAPGFVHTLSAGDTLDIALSRPL